MLTTSQSSCLILDAFMTSKSRKRLLLVACAVGVFAAFWFHYKQRDSYRCQICFARKDVFQWRFGSWMELSVPLTPKREQIGETRFLDDFVHEPHIHDWRYEQGSPYRFFGTTWAGCALGRGLNQLCQMYEYHPGFQAFIARKIDDGSLSKSDFMTLMSSSRTDEPSRKDAEALLKEFFEYSTSHARP